MRAPLVLSGVVAIALLAHARSLGAGFVYDDAFAVVDNPVKTQNQPVFTSSTANVQIPGAQFQITVPPEHVPQPLVDQLREGGRMIIPVGGAGAQDLYVLEKEKGELRRRAISPVRFVPMTGEALKD